MAEGKTRPLLITILGILGLIGAVILIVGSIIGGAALAEYIASMIPGSEFIAGYISAVGVVTGIIALVIAIGYLKGWKPIWYIAVILYILSAIMGILSFPYGIIGTIIDILLIWYFFRPGVKEWFGI
ncbi:MAG: hypothetical protein IKP04_08015 [Candidatus Methanomethylophilaceae archaeon]|nr:hypothetical protein [Candidatus Methanomethylophilaceae archaeon]